MKRFISIIMLVAITMCFCTPTLADIKTDYSPKFSIWLGDNDERIEAKADTSFEKGNIRYDSETKTLYLNGVNAETMHFEDIKGRFNIVLADGTVNTFIGGISLMGDTDAEFHISGNGTLNLQTEYGNFEISRPLYIHSGHITGNNAYIFTNQLKRIYNLGGHFDITGEFYCRTMKDFVSFVHTGGSFVVRGDNPVTFTRQQGTDEAGWVKNYKIVDENENPLMWQYIDNGEKLIPYNADGTVAKYVKILPADFMTSTGELIDEWAKADVESALSKGIVPNVLCMPSSWETGNFTKDITRAEFASIAVSLYKAMGGVEAEGVTSPFTDIEAAPYELRSYITDAYKLGLINGISQTEYAPGNMLTREQAATILCRVYEKSGGEIAGSSSAYADDADISDWAEKYVYFMSDKDIIKGIGENKFAPKMNVSIQQAIAIAARMFENLK